MICTEFFFILWYFTWCFMWSKSPKALVWRVPNHKAENNEFDLKSTKSKVSLATDSIFYCWTTMRSNVLHLRTWFVALRKWVWVLTRKEEFKHLIAYVPSKTYPWYLLYLLNSMIKWLYLDYMTNGGEFFSV